MSNKVGKRLVPELRFPEFRNSGDWGQKQLHETALFVKEKTALVDLSPENYVSTENLLRDFMGMEPSLNRPQNGSATKFKINDVLISNIRPYLKKIWVADIEGGASNDVIVIRARTEVVNLYLSQLLKSDLFIEYVMTGAKGVKMPRGDVELIKKFVVAIPKSPDEQQRIADCLSSLDDLITAQARKIKAFKAHKKGLMQRLFPTEGETVPHLRFSKFQNAREWQANKVATILQRVSNPVEVEPNEFYREIGIRSHGKGIFHKEMVGGAQLGDKRVFWVEINTLVLNIVFAWEQAVATVSKDEAGMIASHRFPMFKGKRKTNVEFVKHFLLTNKGKFLLGLASPGGAGRNRTLGQKEFENLEFYVPVDLDEQVLIADCLSSLDTLIFAHTQKLDILNTLKKGLMQGLFPSINEAEA